MVVFVAPPVGKFNALVGIPSVDNATVGGVAVVHPSGASIIA